MESFQISESWWEEEGIEAQTSGEVLIVGNKKMRKIFAIILKSRRNWDSFLR